MAITTTFGLSVDDGGNLVDEMTAIVNSTISQSNALVYENTQAIGFAAEEAIVVGADISDPGWFYARNLDATNYVQVGSTGVPLAHLKPGEECMFRMVNGITLYAQANVGACNLRVKIYDT